MSDTGFDLKAYLQRIGLDEAPPVTLRGLHQLHRAQFLSIPFENLDIHLGREIKLTPEALFDKLVRQGRGGYCFELNGLLLLALHALGFSAKALLGRVHLGGTSGGRTHQLSLVHINDEDWIIDVGFGATGPRTPIKLEASNGEPVDGSHHRLVIDGYWGWMLQTYDHGEWKNSYSFDLELVTPQDIQVGNFFTSHSPDTHFTQMRIANLPLENGLISLVDTQLTQIDDGEIQETELTEGDEYMGVLKDLLGLDLNADYSAFKPIGR